MLFEILAMERNVQVTIAERHILAIHEIQNELLNCGISDVNRGIMPIYAEAVSAFIEATAPLKFKCDLAVHLSSSHIIDMLSTNQNR